MVAIWNTLPPVDGADHPVRVYLRNRASLPTLHALAAAPAPSSTPVPLSDEVRAELTLLEHRLLLKTHSGVANNEIDMFRLWITTAQSLDYSSRAPVPGSDGQRGDKGAKGDKGAQGNQGNQGAQGPAGAAGGVTHAQLQAALKPLVDKIDKLDDKVDNLDNKLTTRQLNAALAAQGLPLLPLGTIEPYITTREELGALTKRQVVTRLIDLTGRPYDDFEPLATRDLEVMLWSCLGPVVGTIGM